MDWPRSLPPAGIFDPAIASDLRHRAARSRVLFASISAINLARGFTSFELGKIIESGFHHPVLGANFRGGTVHEILEAVDDLPLSVGVVVNAYEEPPATIAVVIDNSAHGWASLDLATRIAYQQECELRLLWIGAPGADGEAELQGMLGVASARVARVSAAPIAAPTADELERQLNCPLVVIGGELADRLGLANHLIDQKRCTIVVYGASVLMPPAARADTAEASVVPNRRRNA